MNTFIRQKAKAAETQKCKKQRQTEEQTFVHKNTTHRNSLIRRYIQHY